MVFWAFTLRKKSFPMFKLLGSTQNLIFTTAPNSLKVINNKIDIENANYIPHASIFLYLTRKCIHDTVKFCTQKISLFSHEYALKKGVVIKSSNIGKYCSGHY